MSSDARALVPCRCDACGELVDFGLPGDEHWRAIRPASWGDGRGGTKRGTILRRCKADGILQPLPKGHHAAT